MPEIKLKAETVALLRRRAIKKGVGCFVCTRILEALGDERELRAWPPGGDQVELPVDGQKAHVQLEIATG